MISDSDILKYYMKGFNDELNGTLSIVDDDIALHSYKLGALHAIIGDDVRYVDYLSAEQILDIIKNEKKIRR